jgi:hypothetical protein
MKENSSDFDSDENEIGHAEWTRNKKTILCSWVKEVSGEKHDFDVNKAEKIFDLRMQEKHLSLPSNHVLPSPEELKKKKWYKWHNTRCTIPVNEGIQATDAIDY